eukprot:15451426-Alexandrium_andersonii.AAC.1
MANNTRRMRSADGPSRPPACRGFALPVAIGLGCGVRGCRPVKIDLGLWNVAVASGYTATRLTHPGSGPIDPRED